MPSPRLENLIQRRTDSVILDWGAGRSLEDHSPLMLIAGSASGDDADVTTLDHQAGVALPLLDCSRPKPKVTGHGDGEPPGPPRLESSNFV
jgi:hypothetical protein